MTTSMSPTKDFTELDRLIIEALGDLRAARSAAARPVNRATVELRSSKAEEHLNALLDYRSAAQRG